MDGKPMPQGEPVHTVLSVLRAAEQWLTARSIEAPKRSAELLLGKVLGLDRLKLYLAFERPLDPAERARMRELLVRRGKHEPVAYLLGEWSFRGHRIEVGPEVLIPRPETEELVDWVSDLLPQGGRVADLGTGSGAIAIAVALLRPDAQVVAADVSEQALAVARRNVAHHQLSERVVLRSGSWWDAMVGEAPFDLVISNPPYIDPANPAGLASDVAAFEPALALYSARGDAASCYRAIFAGLPSRLRSGGHVLMETGLGAAELALAALQATPGMASAELRADLAGHPRFLVGRYLGA